MTQLITYSDRFGTFFGRIDGDGNVAVFQADGASATRLDADVYPIGSETSARYEHAEGIVLSAPDAQRLGIQIDA
jgi:hypothetical protein